MRTRTLLLSALLLGSLFLGTAAAQPLAPPSGPVPAAGPADPYARPMRPDRMQGPGQQRRHRLPPALRAALLQRFDRNGDGRLTGRERMQAKRFVMKHRRELKQQRRQARGGM